MHQTTPPPLQHPLVKLGGWLQNNGYRFVTPTPLTHARVNAREPLEARNLRDIFGWSRPFRAALLPAPALTWLDEAGMLDTAGGLLSSKVRFSSLGDQLYAHSAYPTHDADSVFFGPDTYRFANLIANELAVEPLKPGARILDIGCGAGPGGISAVLASIGTPQLVLADINPTALQFANANAALAGIASVDLRESDLFAEVPGNFDLIVSNPPYLVDAAARTYRHGGGALGSSLSERILLQGMAHLAPGGRLMLYTGAAIVEGEDAFLQCVQAPLSGNAWPFRYRELDPDVFGEELDSATYAHVERIAVVALIVQRPGEVSFCSPATDRT